VRSLGINLRDGFSFSNKKMRKMSHGRKWHENQREEKKMRKIQCHSSQSNREFEGGY
jgi:hypothetical protein